MKVMKIVAAATGGLLVVNTAVNVAIRNKRNGTGTTSVRRVTMRDVTTPAVITYRRTATAA